MDRQSLEKLNIPNVRVLESIVAKYTFWLLKYFNK